MRNQCGCVEQRPILGDQGFHAMEEGKQSRDQSTLCVPHNDDDEDMLSISQLPRERRISLNRPPLGFAPASWMQHGYPIADGIDAMHGEKGLHEGMLPRIQL